MGRGGGPAGENRETISPRRGEILALLRGRGVATRMILLFGLGTTLLFILVQAYEYTQTLRVLRSVPAAAVLLEAEETRIQRDQFLIGGGGFLALLALVLYGTRSITRPLGDLTEAVGRIAEGDLDTPVPPVAGKDELAGLAGAFEGMRHDLVRRMAELEAAAAERARAEGELALARSIQMGFMPESPPSGPFDLAAGLWPAREVGGDLYDHFPEGDRLWLTIGDVSDKGIPAALWISAANLLIRALARQCPDPGKVLSRLNDAWEERNPSCRFLTAICAVADPVSGLIRYARAGHPPPLILRPDGTVTPAPLPFGPVLGVRRGVRFETTELILAPGELILLYTDGVTEAKNGEGHFFGERRLAEVLSRSADPNRSCGETVAAIRQAVADFAGEAPQSDDIALLAFRV